MKYFKNENYDVKYFIAVYEVYQITYHCILYLFVYVVTN